MKAPRPGDVKTRLAAEMGHERAARLARAFFEDTLSTAVAVTDARVVVVVAGDPALLPALPAEVSLWPQGEGDLGGRMERALQRALAEAPRAIVIGTDAPGLPAALLGSAVRATDCDAVLGPADDGGFYLLGVDRCPSGLLDDLPWSSESTLACTQARLEGRGYRVHVLPSWFDVDTPADLARLRRSLAAGEMRAPRTHALLGEDIG
ncbi:MAG: glycosyltransferase [Polyangiaceae bacterium]|nr:glycosyltransferase [Polyangiaceae bacterium]